MEEQKLREDLTSKLIDLGLLTHQMTREGGINNDRAMQISREICLLEKQIHTTSGKYIPSQEERKCPKCMTSYEEGTVFCGSCGQNIKEFYELTAESCNVCNSMVNKEAKYCGVCGSKRNI